MPTATAHRAAPRAAGIVPPLLLIAVGSLLSLSVLLSKLAATGEVKMLWFLTLVFAGAGLILVAHGAATGQMRAIGRFVPFAGGAGILAAGPSAMGYLSVAHVGAGYISLTFAFPVLLTFVFALAMGLYRVTAPGLAAVALGLGGGLVLAVGKAFAMDAGPGWLLVASSIPFMLAAGNIYRTRFWPEGGRPAILAALTLVAGAVAATPVAMAVEGAPTLDARGMGLAAAGALTLALQYLLQFRLQALAGPVYMSQIGAVAAAVGAVLAVVVLGEALPAGFWPASLLIVAGAAVLQVANAGMRKGAA
jgi:drug/metabolite transporter (DMT)-like permease